jgi:hypothetical protein|tara:strand:+ start:1477 stop:1740 length:264 start_codon:yes stop_codon:yes gene_type:complete
MKHFTIIELEADTEAPMIGTIQNIPNTPQGISSFKERFLTAVGEHFDVVDFNHDELPDLFTGSSYEDLGIEIDGVNYTVRIIETWTY